MREKTDEFLERLAPCIEKGDLEACVEEASKLAEEMEIGGEELLDLSSRLGEEERHDFGYVLALTSGQESNPKYASAHYNYAKLLYELGRREEALEPAQEAVEIRRRLSEESPQKFLPDLASSLNNLGVFLSDLGRWEEALKPALEAVEIRRGLAEESPQKFLPDLAMSLNNLGVFLSDLGRREEALKPAQEAVEIRRRLAEESPQKFLPDLASSLNNLGNRLSDLGRREEALKPALEAVEIRRRLAEESPQKFLPDLASSLNNLGVFLSDLGRWEEAEYHFKKAIESGQKYTAPHINYANLLRKMERFSEAEGEVRIALQIDPANPHALSTLGDILADEEYFEEAEEQYREALKNSASMDKSALSEVHNNLGYVYFEMKQNKKAEKEFQRSVSLSRNVKAIRNLRAIKKAETKNSYFRGEIPRYQKCFLIIIVLILLGFCYYLFLFWEIEGEKRLLSDTMFVAQSSILMGLLIFVLFANQLARLKVGAQGVEMEMSTEHRIVEAKSLMAEAALKIER